MAQMNTGTILKFLSRLNSIPTEIPITHRNGQWYIQTRINWNKFRILNANMIFILWFILKVMSKFYSRKYFNEKVIKQINILINILHFKLFNEKY